MSTVRNILTAAVTALSLASCAPEIYTMAVDMRQPSTAGMDLFGKSIAVVYVAGEKDDSLFNARAAEGFAQSIEKEYFGTEQLIPLYCMKETPGAAYHTRDTLVNLIMDSNCDVVLLFDRPEFGTPEIGLPQPTGLQSPDSLFTVRAVLPFDMHIYGYDSLNKCDTVNIYRSSGKSQISLYSNATETEDELKSMVFDAVSAGDKGLNVGVKIGNTFKPLWKTENYSIYFYEGAEWQKALTLAYNFKWKEAAAIWTALAQKSGVLQTSCAAYNIATACYMLEQYDLALEWLDICDANGRLGNSAGLRKRIAQRGNLVSQVETR